MHGALQVVLRLRRRVLADDGCTRRHRSSRGRQEPVFAQQRADRHHPRAPFHQPGSVAERPCEAEPPILQPPGRAPVPAARRSSPTCSDGPPRRRRPQEGQAPVPVLHHGHGAQHLEPVSVRARTASPAPGAGAAQRDQAGHRAGRRAGLGQPRAPHCFPDALTGEGGTDKDHLGRAVHRRPAGDDRHQAAHQDPAAGHRRRSGGMSMFYRTRTCSTIASPLSAYNTVFGGADAARRACRPSALLKRRKSILDVIRGEIGELNQAVGGPARSRSSSCTSSRIRSSRTGSARRHARRSDGRPPASRPARPADDLSNPNAGRHGPPGPAHERLRLRHHPPGRGPVGQQPLQFDTPTGLRGELHMGIIHSARRPGPAGDPRELAGRAVRRRGQEAASRSRSRTARARCSTTPWWSGPATSATPTPTTAAA